MNLKIIKPTNCLLFSAAFILFCLTSFAAANQNMTISYAQGFNVKDFGSCKLITVKPPWRDGASPFRYLLVPRGTPVPEKHPPAQVIRVPVQRVISLSAGELAYMDAAGLTNRLVGVSEFDHVNTKSVRKLIHAGKIREAGQRISMHIETIMDLEPDLIFATASGSIYDIHPKLQEAGIPTAIIIAHLENHPLGKCEWIKFMALFLGTSEHAKDMFQNIADRYNNLLKKTKNIDNRPTVLTGSPFRGQWWVVRGNSYVANFIRDAGGNYLWSDISGVGSVPMDIEAVYERALEARYWIDTKVWLRLEDVLNTDPRFAAVPAFKNENVYNNNKRLNPTDGNDYWEAGMIEPDVILSDLMKILHPELLPEHELVYYRHLK